MRKLSVLVVGIVALAASSLAVAMGLQGGAKSAKLVVGTFNATTASQTSTRSCTTQDGKTIVVSHGKYTGTASGDPDFTGPITVYTTSTINTTDGAGVVSGNLHIDVASSRSTNAHFDAVYDHGNIAGLARGHAHVPYVDLLANLSAGFSTTGGLANGKLGSRARTDKVRRQPSADGTERGTRHRHGRLADDDDYGCRAHLRGAPDSGHEGRDVQGR